MIERHSQDTQTLHAELMALLLAEAGARGFSHLDGSFVTKTVRGGDYLYFQYSDPGGGRRQLSIGPSSPDLEAAIARYRSERDDRDAENERIARLARLLVAAGQAKMPHGVVRVLRALADAGVFHFGGVLVGTYAFLMLANQLGVHWPPGTWRTEDVDVAGHLEVATPRLETDIPRALDSLQMGFVPVPGFDPKHASTSFKVRGQQLRVDLLTPGSDRDDAPIWIPRWNAAAAPIKYLSLLLEDTVPAAAVNGGAILVSVPAPARFALHKLLVSQTRSIVQQTKAPKDLHQAALLLEVLAEDRPDDLVAACTAFAKAGPAVTRKVERAASAVRKRFPDAAAGVAIVLGELGV